MWFLVSKKNHDKVVELELEKSSPSYLLTEILTFDYNKLKLEDDMKKTYDEKLCKIYLKTVCANIINCMCKYNLKRNIYLQIMPIGFSDMVWETFASLMNLNNKRNNNLDFFADPILIKINCNRNYHWIKWLILTIW